METSARKYTRNFDAEHELMISPRKPLTEAEIRRALIERRTIIGPTGDKFEIPKHMSLNDMVSYFKREMGLTHAEVTQVMAAAELLTLRPDYRGKLNRVVMDGAANPLKIDRNFSKIEKRSSTKVDEPQLEEIVMPVIPEKQVIQHTNITDINETRKAASRPPREKQDPSLEIFVRNPSRDNISSGNGNIIKFDAQRRINSVPRTTSYTVKNPNAERENQIRVNGIVADRMRAGRAEERRLEQQRAEQAKALQKQMRARRQEEAKKAQRRRKNRLALVATLGFLYITGILVQVTGLANDIQLAESTPNLIETQDTSDRKLFGVTPETISNFTGDINLISSGDRTNNYSGVTTLTYQQNPVNNIDSASQGLNQNSNLANVLGRFSATSENPITVGEISSYQEFEQILQNGDEALYTSGPAYFAKFSRQMLHAMLKDKYGAETVKATYEKTGENNQNYEFYIRYFKNGSSSERTPEGRVTMTRGANGRLQTNEYHTLPYEVYEMLAMIGEFSDFTQNSNGLPFDIQGYADRYTDGNIQRAKEELRERMTYGTEAMQTLLKERVRADKVEYYRYDR